MLDIKFIRKFPQQAKELLHKRKQQSEIDGLLDLDETRRKKIVENDELKQIKNKHNEEITTAKKQGKDASVFVEGMKDISNKIKEIDREIADIDQNIEQILLTLPNFPEEDVPVGDETNNKVLKEWGLAPTFNFTPLAHWDLGSKLDILEVERGARMSGSGFNILKGMGAKFERVLINFMIDTQTNAGYTEIAPPHLVLRKTVQGSGQLPRMEEDMYNTQPDDLFLIPTSEVALVNMYQGEIIPHENLPIYVTAATSCFRREAGAHGKDTRGLLRVHEFKKVELVKFVAAETSFSELDKMLANAENILQKLNLRYRVLLLSTGDMSFASAKTYDIEVWAPGINRWLEVSSCSNCKDFQARRANIRTKKSGGKPEYPHLLNGSGLAVPRLMAAIWETYQTEDGHIMIPDVLKPFFGTTTKV